MVYDLTHVRFEGVAPPGRRLREVVRSPLAPPPSPPGASETLSGEVSQFVRRVLEREGLDPRPTGRFPSSAGCRPACDSWKCFPSERRSSSARLNSRPPDWP